jgi:hypothetical protein
MVEKGGEPGVPAEDLDDKKALMRTRCRSQRMGQADGARETGAESYAIVRAGNVVVHGLGDADDLDALGVKMNGVAERVVAADGDKAVDAQKFNVLQNFFGEVVDFVFIFIAQMGRHVDIGDGAGAGARSVEEGPAGPSGPVDDLFGQDQEMLSVGSLFVSDDIDEAGPAASDADHPIPFMDGPQGDGADGRVQPRHVAASGQDADNAFFCFHVHHF